MSKQATIYGPADVAEALGVERNVISNWLARHGDTPKPSYVTPNGRTFWNGAGMAAWRRWRDAR